MQMEATETGENAAKLRLKVVAGKALGSVIEVGEELVIGRLAEGDGALGEDIELSREHARILREGDGRFLVEDLGSTNGTYLNGRRLDRPAPLEAGDRIQVGGSALVVQVSAAQTTPPSSDTIVPAPAAESGPLPPLAAADQPPPTPTPDPGSAARASDAPPPHAPPPVVVRIEVDVAAAKATVTLDESSDELRLIYADGRWRLG